MKDRVVRHVPKENLRYMPESGSVLGGRVRNKGLVRVELSHYWIRNNTKKYDRLMGEL